MHGQQILGVKMSGIFDGTSGLGHYD